MRTADILELFERPKVRDIARRLDVFIPPGTRKPEMVTLVARSLGASFGWSGAIDALLETLTRDELLELLEGEWASADGSEFVSSSRLNRLRKDDLIDLARDLFLAEDEDATTTVTDVLASERWSGLFYLIIDEDETEGFDDDDDFEEDADDVDEDPGSIDSLVPASFAPAWHASAILEVSPGGPLPDGFLPGVGRRPLEHQSEAHNRLRDWYAGTEPAGVLCMPTGAGKTQTASRFVVEEAVAPETTVLWLTHREELIDQAISTLLKTAEGLERPLRVGRFQAGNRKAHERVDVLVASIPTLVHGRNLGRVRSIQSRIDLVVVDECHHSAARSWKTLLEQLKRRRARLLGLSATPTRTAERERETLWRIFGKVIYEVRALELIARRVLARPDFEFVDSGRVFDANAREKEAFKRFHERDLPPALIKRIANDAERNRLLASHAVELSKGGRPTLVFASEAVSAQAVVDLIRRGGTQAELISYDRPTAERKAILDGFSKGAIPVLVNLTILSEGTDLPNVENILIGRPTKSAILFAQMVGRGLRGPAIGGTERCRIVVFHEQVLQLASESLSTAYATQADALAALGWEELLDGVDEADAPPPRSTRAAGASSVVPTRHPDGLRAKMQALLARLSGSAPPSSAWGGVPVPLTGWWTFEGGGRRWYLPVFGPDERTLAGVMPRLARHLAGYEALPQEPPLLSLPERMLEQFMAAATDARALPSFVPLEQADASAQTLFAQSILSMADAAGAAGIGDVGAGGTVPSGQPLEPARDTTPPATEKTHAPTSATGGPLRTAPMPVQAPLPSEPAPAAPGRIATLPVGGLRAPVIAMSPSAPREVPTAPHTAAASAPKPTADDLRGVLRAVHNVPREHRREWLAQVHARRFASHYPDLVDLMLDVLAAQDSHR